MGLGFAEIIIILVILGIGAVTVVGTVAAIFLLAKRNDRQDR